MNDKELAFHYICTRDKARELVKAHDRFWVSNCGCREERGGKCSRSRIDLCLLFNPHFSGTGSEYKEISRSEVEEILREAEEKHLVTRPFRNEENRSVTDGICFCCDDCCGYFVHPDEYKCDKGDQIELTDEDRCANCGSCVDVCYFSARTMDEERLAVDREACYGCGLCIDVCPQNSISMVKRD